MSCKRRPCRKSWRRRTSLSQVPAPSSLFRLARHAESPPCVRATAVEADEVASRSYALTKVPKKLQADFDEMRDHRTRVLNRFRSGSAVVDTTFDHDVSSTLRYENPLALLLACRY